MHYFAFWYLTVLVFVFLQSNHLKLFACIFSYQPTHVHCRSILKELAVKSPYFCCCLLCPISSCKITSTSLHNSPNIWCRYCCWLRSLTLAPICFPFRLVGHCPLISLSRVYRMANYMPASSCIGGYKHELESQTPPKQRQIKCHSTLAGVLYACRNMIAASFRTPYNML